MSFFKCLDTEGNGSISTEELIKLWLVGREVSDPGELLYKLLARHLREIQFPDPLLRFQTLGYDEDDFVNEGVIKDVFEKLNFTEEYIKAIESMIPSKSTVSDFSESLKSGGVSKSLKVFKKMSKS